MREIEYSRDGSISYKPSMLRTFGNASPSRLGERRSVSPQLSNRRSRLASKISSSNGYYDAELNDSGKWAMINRTIDQGSQTKNPMTSSTNFENNTHYFNQEQDVDDDEPVLIEVRECEQSGADSSPSRPPR